MGMYQGFFLKRIAINEEVYFLKLCGRMRGRIMITSLALQKDMVSSGKFVGIERKSCFVNRA